MPFFQGAISQKYASKNVQNTSPRLYFLYMRFPYLSCEITWPQGRPRGPSQGQGHMGPWAEPRGPMGRTQARAQGRGAGPGPLD